MAKNPLFITNPLILKPKEWAYFVFYIMQVGLYVVTYKINL